MAYDAFMSYSHAADGQLAPALQNGLQRLAKPWYRLRALRVFRDETGLSTNPHLWSAIVEALDAAEWFVLLASPEAATSPWVDQEIGHWLETKSADRLLPVVTAGEWGWDATEQQLVGDAVPPRLRAALRDEPRHLDLRWAGTQTDLDLRHSGFRSAVADLAAPMHGVAKDELEGEDIRQHRRARRLARGAVSVVVLLLILSIVFGGFAITQRNRANGAARDAELRGLVSDAGALLSQDRPLALLLAAEAYRRRPDANARDALLGAVLTETRLQLSFGPTSGIAYAGHLTGTRVAVATDPASGRGHELSVWDWKTGHRVAWPAAPPGVVGPGCANTRAVGLATSPDGERIAVVTADGLVHLFSGRTLDAQGGTVNTGLSFPACHAQTAFSSDGRWLAVANADGRFPLHARFAGKTVALLGRNGDHWRPGPPLTGHHTRVGALAFNKDGSILATGSPAGTDPKANPGLIVLHDVRTGRTLERIETNDDPISLALDSDHHRVVAGTLANDTVAYDLDNPSEPKPVRGRGTFTRVVYNAEWTQLAISGSGGFRLLDAGTLEPIDGSDIEPKSSPPVAAVYLPGDQILLVGSGGPMTVWDLRSTSVLQTVVSKLPSVSQTAGPHVFVSPTARPKVFVADKSTSDGTFITILGPDYRPLTHEIRVGARQPFTTAWCADPHTNQIATVGTGTPDDTGDIVVRRGVPPFEVVRRTRGVDFVPFNCYWRPDGKQIAIGGPGGGVALYQVATGKIRRVDVRPNEYTLSLSYRLDSTELWVTGPAGGPARITNLDRTPQVAALPAALGEVSALRFTPDGRFLVTAEATNVQVLDAHTLAPRTGHIGVTADVINWVGVSPDSHAAVTLDLGGGLRLVDLRAGRAIGPRIPMAFPGAAVFGRDDTTLYASTPDGRATVWNFAPDRVRDAACALAGRNFTQEEWHRYLPWAGPPWATCAQFPPG